LDVVLRALNLNPTESELKEMINEIDPTQTGFINLDSVYLIAERKMKDTDTLEELVEALKCFDGDKDGKITVTDFRYAMTALGEELDEEMVDDMIKEADNDNDGLIDIIEFAKICFNIKEKN
jgi:Ca2+-binding EF-hand superfamily protein